MLGKYWSAIASAHSSGAGWPAEKHHETAEPNSPIPPLADVLGEIGVTVVAIALAFAAVIWIVKLAI